MGLWNNKRPLHLPIECSCGKQYLATVLFDEDGVNVETCPDCGVEPRMIISTVDADECVKEANICSADITWRSSGQTFTEASFQIKESPSCVEVLLNIIQTAEAYFGVDAPNVLTFSVVTELFTSWPVEIQALIHEELGGIMQKRKDDGGEDIHDEGSETPT